MLDILNPSSGRSVSQKKKKKVSALKEEEKWSHPSLYCRAIAMKNNHKEDGWRRRQGKKKDRVDAGDWRVVGGVGWGLVGKR